MFNIKAIDSHDVSNIQNKINNKTKPLGSLGQLESLALQMAKVQAGQERLTITAPTMLVFAGDHGIAKEGVSIAPQAVTRQMLLNFLAGGAAVNVFSRQSGLALGIIDAGIVKPLTFAEQSSRHAYYFSQRLGGGTRGFHMRSAMTTEQVDQGLIYARELVEQYHAKGCNLLALGEMGIGNTSSAAAILAALTDLDAKDCVGRGTGIDDETYAIKVALVQQALNFHRKKLVDAKSILTHVGGFEIVQLTGAILAAAERRMLVVIDGFIVTAAALLAVEMHPECRDYLIFAHNSAESGHQLMLNLLGAEPLLHLGMRLGEGSGAALCLPIIQAAVNFYNEMASFDDAKITSVIDCQKVPN
ncbi:nicotinate-nucleotide--dimethylbenzimidazole phosphoribosyltransferase [Shewanella sp. NIFS-20-20]|uniref:nicotinate-nucleotide--dimethylbenzimidazole phosphoribosyltransferase n=1 Tax=Shewanella sp. NIFS-20-20 TaxID=2853806 RepID=UPI001C4656FE|nr:nicotinate-nucleotide--dimethylbenzimidazole phosphoribosyltransferase [Shewanella sp. NIFS-20-20]MBV7314747.1 nicotinate-nucleotide--dimethylbenzimidazole phosphoribosyltransferase [Shewanella sp. NIFS-20-20]